MTGTITMTPIGRVEGGRTEATDDDWGDEVAVIQLDPAVVGPDATAALDSFSHVEVVFVFDRVDETRVQRGARRPRGREDWPEVGILAQRAKARPNRLGLTTCELVAVDGLRITVRGLDAISGTPVLDVKPHMTGFGPRTPVREPAWATELMDGYW